MKSKQDTLNELALFSPPRQMYVLYSPPACNVKNAQAAQSTSVAETGDSVMEEAT